MDANDTEPNLDSQEAGRPGGRRGAISRARARLGRTIRRGPVVAALSLAVVAALIGAAYVVGSPPSASHDALGLDSTQTSRFGNTPGMDGSLNGGGPMAAATSAPVPAFVSGGTIDKTGGGNGDAPLVVDTNQIIKTGQLALEVADIDKASGDSRKAIAALGGTASDSSQNGTGDNVIASITFRVPSARFDDAVTALRAVGTKTLSMQTSSQDVTQQVVDVEARLDNLRRTETALQAIMDKATVIADIIAVQNQLTQTQGEIEQLTAQRDSLKNQAAMSTIQVSFQLPARTVTTQATQDWTLSNQIDQAGAALVRIGQGLATMGVWLVVVVLPVGLVVFVLLLIGMVFRRLSGRGKQPSAAA